MNENWVFGAVCSIAIHAVGLGLIVGYGRSGRDASAAAEEPESPPAPAAVAAPAPSEERPAASAAASAAPSAAPEPRPAADLPRTSAPSEGPAFYVVKPGDNLTRIARENGTTPEALAEINGKTLKQMNLLYVGQKVKLR